MFSLFPGYLPMWESFPSGGCWIIRVRISPPTPLFRALSSPPSFLSFPSLETESEIARPVTRLQ
jgi:hypothetical protein